jgi:aspartate/methionine/tyrosine aminotransferase
MAKLLTNREMELFNLAVNIAVGLDYHGTEIGIEPIRQAIAEKISKNLSFKIDEDDIYEVSEIITGSQGE